MHGDADHLAGAVGAEGQRAAGGCIVAVRRGGGIVHCGVVHSHCIGGGAGQGDGEIGRNRAAVALRNRHIADPDGGHHRHNIVVEDGADAGGILQRRIAWIAQGDVEAFIQFHSGVAVYGDADHLAGDTRPEGQSAAGCRVVAIGCGGGIIRRFIIHRYGFSRGVGQGDGKIGGDFATAALSHRNVVDADSGHHRHSIVIDDGADRVNIGQGHIARVAQNDGKVFVRFLVGIPMHDDTDHLADDAGLKGQGAAGGCVIDIGRGGGTIRRFIIHRYAF